MKNVHPVDELADIRAEIRELEERAEDLRQVILANGARTLRGDRYVASIVSQEQERFDMDAARKTLGAEALRPFRKRSIVTMVRVFRLIDEEDVAPPTEDMAH